MQNLNSKEHRKFVIAELCLNFDASHESQNAVIRGKCTYVERVNALEVHRRSQRERKKM